MDMMLVYVGILVAMLLFLSFRISLRRAKPRAGGEEDLRRAVRAQGNFIEYVPLQLIAIGFLAAAPFSEWLIHVLSIAVIVIRAGHAAGMISGQVPLIAGSATLNYLLLAIMATLCLLSGLFGFIF